MRQSRPVVLLISYCDSGIEKELDGRDYFVRQRSGPVPFKVMSGTAEELSGQVQQMQTPMEMVRNITRAQASSASNEAATVSRTEVAAVFQPDSDTLAAGVVTIRQSLDGTAASSLSDFDVEAAYYARKGDTARAAALLTSFSAWRQRVGDANPISCPKLLELLRAGLIISAGTRDRDGRAVVYTRLSKLDSSRFDALTVLRTICFVMLYTVRTYPWARTHGMALMQDMKGVQLRKLDSRVPGEMRNAFSQTLPVRIASMNVLSPPAWIRLIFALVSKFTGAKMKTRLRIIPDGESLLEVVEPDQMLAFAGLGGTVEWTDEQHEAWIVRMTEECKSWPGIDLSAVEEQMRRNAQSE